MANMTFKTNLLPNSNLGYSLGSSDLKWNIYGDLTGKATQDGSGNTITDTYVKKSGDTMTGNLTVTNTAPEIIAKSSISNIATSISTSSDGKSHGLWSYGYSSNGTSLTSDGKWMIYRDGNGNIIVNGKSTENVLKTGDTMTGNLFVKKSSAPFIGVIDSNNNLSVRLHVGTGHQNHGLYSTGYATDDNLANNTYTNDEKWMVYRDKNGNVQLNGNADTVDGLHASSFPKIFSMYSGQYGAVIVNHGSTGSNGTRGQCIAYGNGNGVPWLAAITYGYDYVRTVNLSSTHLGKTKWISATQFAIIASSWDQITIIQSGDSMGAITSMQAASSSYTADANNSYAWINGNAVTGAVWNDYAEYREADILEPGYVLVETGKDSLTKSSKRLQIFAGISSDTWGFAQGETEKAKTPIAVAGRVLVYPGEDRDKYQPGDCVCAGPDGKVYIMTREEICEWPDRIVGVVSCIPDYEEWGGGKNADRPSVKINGRIWIRIK